MSILIHARKPNHRVGVGPGSPKHGACDEAEFRIGRANTQQITAQAIPANHPVVPQLTNLFGDHTFFLDEEGLLIVEPAEATRSGAPAGRLVKLASWNDANRKTLAPHEAEATDVLVELAPEGSEQ